MRTAWLLIDGKDECVGVEVERADPEHAHPLRARDLRLIPFGAHVAAERRDRVLRASEQALEDEIEEDLLADLEADLTGRRPRRRPDYERILGLSSRVRGAYERSPGRPPLRTDEDYREIAAVYDKALREGQSVVKAVADHATVEHGHAGKLIAEARKRGLLPPTTRGRPKGND